MREPDVRCEFDYGAGAGLCGKRAASACSGPAWRPPRTLRCSEHLGLERHLFGDASVAPLLRDPRIACIVVAAITGAVPHDRAAWDRVQAILREAWSLPKDAEAQRRDVISIALDAIEEAGLHEPEAWPRDAGVVWPRAVHTHRWFARARTSDGIHGITIPLSGRCTCGAREIDEVGRAAVESELARRSAGSHRFRYADGRVEWRDANADDLDRGVVLDEPRAPRVSERFASYAPGPRVRHVFRPFRVRQEGYPDVIEFHEHNNDPRLRLMLSAAARTDIRAERDSESRLRRFGVRCALRRGHHGPCESIGRPVTDRCPLRIPQP